LLRRVKAALARRYIAGIGLQWAGKTLIQRAQTAWPALAFRDPDRAVVVVAANALDEARPLVFTDGEATLAVAAEPLSFNALVLPA